MSKFDRVVIESPYAGEVEENLAYLRAAMADCIARGEAPFASHGLYTQEGVLNDGDARERRKGILAGFSWRHAASKTVVYEDLGVSYGMRLGVRHSRMIGVPVEFRRLERW